MAENTEDPKATKPITLLMLILEAHAKGIPLDTPITARAFGHSFKATHCNASASHYGNKMEIFISEPEIGAVIDYKAKDTMRKMAEEILKANAL